MNGVTMEYQAFHSNDLPAGAKRPYGWPLYTLPENILIIYGEPILRH